MNYAGIEYERHSVTLLVQGAKEKNGNEIIRDEYRDPNKGILFTDGTQEDILEYLDNDNIKRLILSGGDPLYDHNIDIIYNLLTIFRAKYKDTKKVWLYTEYRWDDFIYWKHIKESGLNLGDKYKTRLKIIELVDIVYCAYIHSVTDYVLIDAKKSLSNSKNVIIYNTINNNVDE
jgi:organic radical activating enzyme